MSNTAVRADALLPTVEEAVRDLLKVQKWGDATFVTVPLIYPGGSFVTIKVEQAPGGLRVSDNGFAYREVEAMGATRGFAKAGEKISAYNDVFIGKRSIYVNVGPEELTRAICDVAKASCLIADKIVGKASEEAASELEEHLRTRLISVFGKSHVADPDATMMGASTNPWDVSAIVDLGDRKAVFQAVANYPMSIFRTHTMFGDLAALDVPPKMISFVKNKEELGKNLALLAQAGYIVEDGQADAIFVRAAA